MSVSRAGQQLSLAGPQSQEDAALAADSDSEGAVDAVGNLAVADASVRQAAHSEGAVEFVGDIAARASANLLKALACAALSRVIAVPGQNRQRVTSMSCKCRGPHTARAPWRVGVARLGSALLRRSGAHARIVPMSITDGVE